MSLIEVRALSKRFRTPKKAPGMAGAIKQKCRELMRAFSHDPQRQPSASSGSAVCTPCSVSAEGSTKR
jgi:hypothetical protein